jgi:hypothetical protein
MASEHRLRLASALWLIWIATTAWVLVLNGGSVSDVVFVIWALVLPALAGYLSRRLEVFFIPVLVVPVAQLIHGVGDGDALFAVAIGVLGPGVLAGLGALIGRIRAGEHQGATDRGISDGDSDSRERLKIAAVVLYTAACALPYAGADSSLDHLNGPVVDLVVVGVGLALGYWVRRSWVLLAALAPLLGSTLGALLGRQLSDEDGNLAVIFFSGFMIAYLALPLAAGLAFGKHRERRQARNVVDR